MPFDDHMADAWVFVHQLGHKMQGREGRWQNIGGVEFKLDGVTNDDGLFFNPCELAFLPLLLDRQEFFDGHIKCRLGREFFFLDHKIGTRCWDGDELGGQ